MSKKMILIIALAAISVLVLADNHEGYGNNCGNRRMKEHGMGHSISERQMRFRNSFDCLEGELELTDSQKENIAELRTEFKKSEIDLEAKIEKTRLEKREAMKAEDFKKAEKKIDKLALLNAEAQKLHLQLMQETHSLLTEEQIAELKRNRPHHRGMQKNNHRMRNFKNNRHCGANRMNKSHEKMFRENSRKSHHGKMMHKDGAKNPFSCLEGDLELTEDQREEIRKIHLSTKKNEIDLTADIAKVRINKRDAMYNQKFDNAAKYIDEMSELSAEMQKLKMNEKMKISNILTDDQKEELENNRFRNRK